MTEQEMTALLDRLIENWEDEVVEFKEAGAGYSLHSIGKYFSALSNEANLRALPRAWLVLGVENKTRRVKECEFGKEPGRLDGPQGLKMQITEGTDPSVSLVDIHELHHPDGRVLLLEIPAAPRGTPVAWQGHYYARSGESLVALGLDKLDEIRNQGLSDDWSAVPVADATYDDLDEQAITKARQGFYEKNSLKYTEEEVNGWDLRTFLDRARLTRKGVITRTTMLLVGKELSAHLLSPYPAQLVWKLLGEEQGDEIFYPPFLLATNRLYARIRNVLVDVLPQGELIPRKVPKYVDKSVLEALHNCIAHQNYRLNGRVVVSEYVDRLVFENRGNFFEGKPEEYIDGKKTPSQYRNLQLVTAMREVNMIDTQGYGIHRLYVEQRKRYFPMPDYELGRDYVRMTIFGHVVDPAYSSLLIRRTDLNLDDVCLLDRVQKNLKIDARAVAHLRQEGLIEGRVPHLHISAQLAALTNQKAAYMKKKERTGAHYRGLLIDYIGKFNGLTRAEINEYMLEEIRGDLTEREKLTKIGNLLTYLRRKGDIYNSGTDTKPLWKLTDKARNALLVKETCQ